MTLKEYLKTGTTDIRSIASALSVSEGAVHKWVYGQRRPDLTTALAIVKETGGAVDLQTLMGAETVEAIKAAVSQGAFSAEKAA